MVAGLPEIWGYTYGAVTYGEQQNGALYSPAITNFKVQAPVNGGGSMSTGSGYIFNASKCDTTYGSSTTVTPKSLKVGWYIKF